MGAVGVCLLSTVPLAEAEEIKREVGPVHLNLKTGDGFSPETEHDANHVGEVRSVQANTQQIGNVIYEVDWAEVGTWTSPKLVGDFTAQGRVVFNVWYQVTEEVNNNNVDWEFTLRYNGEDVAFVELTAADQDTEKPIEVSVETSLDYVVRAASGDTFSVYIRYRSAADCDLYYDNINYDSGATINADPVIFFSGRNSGGEAAVEFFDVFGIDWDRHGKYFCQVVVDGKSASGSDLIFTDQGEEREGDSGSSYSTTWLIFPDTPEGRSTTITISYGVAAGNQTTGSWSFSFKGKDSGGGGDGDGDGDNNQFLYFGGGLALVAMVGLVLFRKRRNKREDEEEDWEDDDYDDDDEDGEQEMEYSG